MSIKYKTVARKNPREQQLPAKFYANAVSVSKINLKTLAKTISKRTSLDHVDAEAVVSATVDIILEELADGNMVQLGDLGSFSVSLSSTGAETEDKFSAASIEKARIIYRPGAELKNMLKTLKYEKTE